MHVVEKRCIYTGGTFWEEVTCDPETRDHCRDMRSGHCHGDHGSSCWCQVLLEKHQRHRQGTSPMHMLKEHLYSP